MKPSDRPGCCKHRHTTKESSHLGSVRPTRSALCYGLRGAVGRLRFMLHRHEKRPTQRRLILRLINPYRNHLGSDGGENEVQE